MCYLPLSTLYLEKLQNLPKMDINSLPASDKFCRLVMIITNRLDNIYTFQVTWQGPQCHGRNCSWFILVVPFTLEIVYLLIVLNPMTFTYKILEI